MKSESTKTYKDIYMSELQYPNTVPADDSNFDNIRDVKLHDHEIWSYEQGKDKPTVKQLEDNVKDAVKKRNNVIKLREIDWTEDDWYFGC